MPIEPAQCKGHMQLIDWWNCKGIQGHPSQADNVNIIIWERVYRSNYHIINIPKQNYTAILERLDKHGMVISFCWNQTDRQPIQASQNITKRAENQAEPDENTTKLAKQSLNWVKYTWISQTQLKPASNCQKSTGNRPKHCQKTLNQLKCHRKPLKSH